ncbi:MAG: heavy-metal-associated domain-containing protein [Nocardioidaceae bacterium]
METTTYRVDGMSCAHCVAAVQEEVGALPEVREVAVDLVAGGTSTVTVRAATAPGDQAVREAVAEAGYTLQ